MVTVSEPAQFTTMHENARSALEYGSGACGAAPLGSKQWRLPPPHSKVPSAKPFSGQGEEFERRIAAAAEKGRRGGFTPPSDVEDKGYMAGRTRRYIPTNLFFSSPLDLPRLTIQGWRGVYTPGVYRLAANPSRSLAVLYHRGFEAR